MHGVERKEHVALVIYIKGISVAIIHFTNL